MLPLQAPLLSWGPPVLQRWQRLLLLEEHACERDMASYSVFNIRVATAVFAAAVVPGAEQQPQQRRRYSISAWPTQPPEDAQVRRELQQQQEQQQQRFPAVTIASGSIAPTVLVLHTQNDGLIWSERCWAVDAGLFRIHSWQAFTACGSLWPLSLSM